MFINFFKAYPAAALTNYKKGKLLLEIIEKSLPKQTKKDFKIINIQNKNLHKKEKNSFLGKKVEKKL